MWDYLNKYEFESRRDTKSHSFRNDWISLKESVKDNVSDIRFLMEQFVEKKFPTSMIKELFVLNPNNEQIKNHPDLFKWAAAFHSEPLIRFFHENLNTKDEEGAINAAIINYRLDNLKTLKKLGINVFSEKHFCQAIQRSYQLNSSEIVDYYVLYVNKFETTEYSKNILNENQRLIFWAANRGSLNTVDYLIQQGNKFDRKDLIIYACEEGKLDVVKYLVESKNFRNRKDIAPLKEKDLSEIFLRAANFSNQDIVEYLIFEKNVKFTKEIASFLASEHYLGHEGHENLFKIRDANNKLTKELTVKDEVQKPAPKIKI